jgi:hypothetical protein
MRGRGPKLGERVYARSPNFGYPLDFREVLRMDILKKMDPPVCNPQSPAQSYPGSNASMNL